MSDAGSPYSGSGAKVTALDDQLRLAKIQLQRAVAAQEKYPDDWEIGDIIDEIMGRIETLTLARAAQLRAQRECGGSA